MPATLRAVGLSWVLHVEDLTAAFPVRGSLQID